MEFYQVWLAVVSGLIGIIMFLWRSMHEQQEAFKKKVAHDIKEIQMNYVLKADLKEIKIDLGHRFDKLEEKLDQFIKEGQRQYWEERRKRDDF